jgi:hypothetical protein
MASLTKCCGEDALGCCYQRCRSFALSQKYYEQSLKIYKKTLGYDHPSIGRVLHNIGYEVSMPVFS